MVVPAAFLYGFYPGTLLDIHLNTVDELNAYKAIMGLYFGCSLLWFFGIIDTTYLKTALLSNMVFMLGLGFGRLLSLIVDGTPTLVYALGTVGELILGFYGFWVLKTQKNID